MHEQCLAGQPLQVHKVNIQLDQKNKCFSKFFRSSDLCALGEVPDLGRKKPTVKLQLPRVTAYNSQRKAAVAAQLKEKGRSLVALQFVRILPSLF